MVLEPTLNLFLQFLNLFPSNFLLFIFIIYLYTLFITIDIQQKLNVKKCIVNRSWSEGMIKTFLFLTNYLLIDVTQPSYQGIVLIRGLPIILIFALLTFIIITFIVINFVTYFTFQIIQIYFNSISSYLQKTRVKFIIIFKIHNLDRMNYRLFQSFYYVKTCSKPFIIL